MQRRFFSDFFCRGKAGGAWFRFLSDFDVFTFKKGLAIINSKFRRREDIKMETMKRWMLKGIKKAAALALAAVMAIGASGPVYAQ